MPRYHQLGNIPKKRHTVFKSSEGNFYYEELFGTVGFDGMSSLLYHTHRPTQVKEIVKSYSVAPKVAVEKNMESLALKGFSVPSESDFLKSRKQCCLTQIVISYWLVQRNHLQLIFIKIPILMK